MTQDDVTFVINTFKSEKIISSCLNSIPINFKKIVIENSSNQHFKTWIESTFPNTKCFLMNENSGYGKGNNYGIKKSDTNYVFIINPDTEVDKEQLEIFFNLLKDKDFAICAPIVKEKDNIYDNGIKANQATIEVSSVPGMALLLNKKKFQNNFFDESFFLYLEEIDLCRRVKANNDKILQVNAFVNHLGGLSHGSFNIEMEKSRNWHWMWSKFYFHKKYNNKFFTYVYFSNLFFFILIKFLLSKLLKKKKNYIYKSRLQGLTAAICGKKSYYRPNL